MLDLQRSGHALELYSMEEVGYFRLPEEFATGSSIMPQKKNPDVLELVRAKFAVVHACYLQTMEILKGLPSGYQRDLQLTKAALIDDYEKRFPEAIRCLEEGLEDSLSFYDFPEVDKKRISSTNGQERLNMEIRRRSRVVGVFPSVESYVRLTICYLIEYAEDWASERSYIREDKVLGSLDRLHELTAQAAN
jgi:hypothetical protein